MSLTAFILTTVLIIGDSEAFMVGRELRNQAPDTSQVIFAASPGSGTDFWAQPRRTTFLLRRHKPTLVVVSLGTNDAGGYVSRKAFPRHAAWIIQEVHRHKAKIVWVTAPKTKIDTAFADRYILRSKVDGVFHSKCLDLPLMGDRVHPTIPASRDWARRVWTYLKHGTRPCTRFRFRWPRVHTTKGLTLSWTF